MAVEFLTDEQAEARDLDDDDDGAEGWTELAPETRCMTQMCQKPAKG
ncbi:hypothetical protein [Streptomyces sp. NPDC060035]